MTTAGKSIFIRSLQGVNERTRAVVVVHPNNPTGSFVRQTERAELDQFCRDNDLSLIVDEVFLDYAHDHTRRDTFVSNQEVLTFTLSGLSKISGLPQMKLAWIVTTGRSDNVIAALNRLEIIADTYLSVNAPIQLALPVLLEQRKNIQPQLLERVRDNLQGTRPATGASRKLARDSMWRAGGTRCCEFLR